MPLDDKNLRYRGSFKNGKRHGMGTQFSSVGGKVSIDFKGEFRKGRRYKGHLPNQGNKSMFYDEYGVEIPASYQFDDGTYYEGEFSFIPEPLPSGVGKRYNSSKMLIHSGKYVSGMYHGAGTLYRYDFSDDGSICTIIRYKGNFVKGKLNGPIEVSLKEKVPKLKIANFLSNDSDWIKKGVYQYEMGSRKDDQGD